MALVGFYIHTLICFYAGAALAINETNVTCFSRLFALIAGIVTSLQFKCSLPLSEGVSSL